MLLLIILSQALPFELAAKRAYKEVREKATHHSSDSELIAEHNNLIAAMLMSTPSTVAVTAKKVANTSRLLIARITSANDQQQLLQEHADALKDELDSKSTLISMQATRIQELVADLQRGQNKLMCGMVQGAFLSWMAVTISAQLHRISSKAHKANQKKKRLLGASKRLAQNISKCGKVSGKAAIDGESLEPKVTITKSPSKLPNTKLRTTQRPLQVLN